MVIMVIKHLLYITSKKQKQKRSLRGLKYCAKVTEAAT